MFRTVIRTPGILGDESGCPEFPTLNEAWGYLADARRRAEEARSCRDECAEGPGCRWNYCTELSETWRDLDYLRKDPTLGTDSFDDTDVCRNEDGTGYVLGETPGCHGSTDPGVMYVVYEVFPDCESTVSPNHSQDRITVFSGKAEPRILCGYHARREGLM